MKAFRGPTLFSRSVGEHIRSTLNLKCKDSAISYDLDAVFRVSMEMDHAQLGLYTQVRLNVSLWMQSCLFDLESGWQVLVADLIQAMPLLKQKDELELNWAGNRYTIEVECFPCTKPWGRPMQDAFVYVQTPSIVDEGVGSDGELSNRLCLLLQTTRSLLVECLPNQYHVVEQSARRAGFLPCFMHALHWIRDFRRASKAVSFSNKYGMIVITNADEAFGDAGVGHDDRDADEHAEEQQNHLDDSDCTAFIRWCRSESVAAVVVCCQNTHQLDPRLQQIFNDMIRLDQDPSSSSMSLSVVQCPSESSLRSAAHLVSCHSAVSGVMQCLNWLFAADGDHQTQPRPCSSLLLIGAPGTGKSTLLNGISQCLGETHCIDLKLSQVIHGYIGQSEKAIQSVFRRARRHAPCVILIDDVDVMFPSDERANDRSLQSQFHSELDHLRDQDKVMLICSTRDPARLDSRLIRMGRLDRIEFMENPSVEEIAQVVSSKSIADKMKGLTMADVKVCLRDARIQCQISKDDNEEQAIRDEHFDLDQIQQAVQRNQGFQFTIEMWKTSRFN